MTSSLRLSFVGAIFFALVASESTAHAQRTVPVNIESTPPGAQVFVDSTDVAALGVTPLANKPLVGGAHTIIFRMNGYEEMRLPITVARRRETFRAALVAMATISIRPGNEAANGALVRVDGQPSGTVPTEASVRGGRHLVQVGREGYVTSSQWVDVASGQSSNLVVPLEREAPQSGSIIVASDITGARVFVDGVERGTTPTVIESLTPGTHSIELRADGVPSRTQTVSIFAGQRETLNVTLREAQATPTSGSLRVIVVPHGAIVSLDGDVLGQSPVSRDNLTPGEHIVDVSAEGYEPAQQTITIEPGRQRAVSVTLTPRAAAPGRIVVSANVGAAMVTIDGGEPHAVPYVLENAPPGAHAIVVTAPGYDDYRATCEVGPGRNCELSAALRSGGVRIRVTSNVNGGRLIVDGVNIGPVPYVGSLPAGGHRIEVQADGYQSYLEQVDLTPQNEARVISATLTPVHVGPTEADIARLEDERARNRFGAASHAAGVLPVDLFVLDLSLGWPHLGEVRLGIGINDWFEAGVAFRTFGRLTEFEGRAKFSYRPIQQIAIGTLARFGGGLGPNDVNSFFMKVDALASIYFTNRGAFTLWLGGEGYTDAYPYSGTDSGRRLASNDRDNALRLRLGGSLELVLTEHWNVWGVLDGVLYGDGRRIFGDFILNNQADTEFYFRLGGTYKF